MKNIIFLSIALVFIFSGILFAHDKDGHCGNCSGHNEDSNTAEFKVFGACGMCKTRIEKAAKETEGVLSASWDLESNILSLEFDPALVSLETVHKNIAAAGHDTELFQADDEVYAKLPACCKYNRYEKSDETDVE